MISRSADAIYRTFTNVSPVDDVAACLPWSRIVRPNGCGPGCVVAADRPPQTCPRVFSTSW